MCILFSCRYAENSNMGKITDLKNSETIVPLARAALLFQYCPITHKSGESIKAAAIPELNIDMIHGNNQKQTLCVPGNYRPPVQSTVTVLNQVQPKKHFSIHPTRILYRATNYH